MDSAVRSILIQGVDLSEHGVIDWGFAKSEALEIIAQLSEMSAVILGGDVYNFRMGKVTPTYDSWYFEPKIGETRAELTARSVLIAEKYISAYDVSKATNSLILFTFVVL